jgi:hypothetical protein
MGAFRGVCVCVRVQGVNAASALSCLLAQTYFVPFALTLFAALARIQVSSAAHIPHSSLCNSCICVHTCVSTQSRDGFVSQVVVKQKPKEVKQKHKWVLGPRAGVHVADACGGCSRLQRGQTCAALPAVR